MDLRSMIRAAWEKIDSLYDRFPAETDSGNGIKTSREIAAERYGFQEARDTLAKRLMLLRNSGLTNQEIHQFSRDGNLGDIVDNIEGLGSGFKLDEFRAAYQEQNDKNAFVFLDKSFILTHRAFNGGYHEADGTGIVSGEGHSPHNSKGRVYAGLAASLAALALFTPAGGITTAQAGEDFSPDGKLIDFDYNHPLRLQLGADIGRHTSLFGDEHNQGVRTGEDRSELGPIGLRLNRIFMPDSRLFLPADVEISTDSLLAFYLSRNSQHFRQGREFRLGLTPMYRLNGDSNREGNMFAAGLRLEGNFTDNDSQGLFRGEDASRIGPNLYGRWQDLEVQLRFMAGAGNLDIAHSRDANTNSRALNLTLRYDLSKLLGDGYSVAVTPIDWTQTKHDYGRNGTRFDNQDERYRFLLRFRKTGEFKGKKGYLEGMLGHTHVRNRFTHTADRVTFGSGNDLFGGIQAGVNLEGDTYAVVNFQSNGHDQYATFNIVGSPGEVGRALAKGGNKALQGISYAGGQAGKGGLWLWDHTGGWLYNQFSGDGNSAPEQSEQPEQSEGTSGSVPNGAREPTHRIRRNPNTGKDEMMRLYHAQAAHPSGHDSAR